VRLYDALDRDLGAMLGVVEPARRSDVALLMDQVRLLRSPSLLPGC
jgi:hypothetical protein